MAAQRKWRLVGDYFENCSCDIVCPCLVSTKAMSARPTQGVCDVVALLHGGFERRDGAVVESFTQRGRNWLAPVFAFG